ncbi:MAG: MBL fold metallo-hydrolase [Pseudomonadales bacterium]
MKQLFPDLWQSQIYSAGSMSTSAFLLTRPSGNILFYNTNSEEDLERIEALGGFKYQLLTHRDEADANLERLRQRFGHQLIVPEGEANAIAKYARADRFFERTDHKFDAVDVLQTPGHTSSCVSFSYHSEHGGHYLFCGDTLFQWNNQWATLILQRFGGSAEAMIASLDKLAPLNPDVVMSSGFVNSVAPPHLVTAEQWQSLLSTVQSRLLDERH